MVEEENEHLLTNTDRHYGDNFACIFARFLPNVILYHLGLVISLYAISEWIQHYEESRIFRGAKDNSSSECGIRNKSDPNYKLYELVETETSKWQMYVNLAWYIPAAVSTTVLPSYSDCFGRKFILIIGTTGTIVKMITATVVMYFNTHPIYIVYAAIVEGCTGSFFSVGSGCYTFVSDLTQTGRKRTVGLAIYDGTVLICTTLAGLASGYCIQAVGFFITTAACCGIVFISYIYLITLVPETFPRHLRPNSKSVFVVFRRTFAFYFTETFRKKRCAYLLLLIAYILENMANGHRASLEMLYQLGRPFCWSLDKIGLFSGLRHVAQGFAGLLFVKPLQACLSDINISILSIAFSGGSFILEAMARTDLALYMVALLATFGYLCETMIKSLMSSLTPPDKQGSLFSSVVLTQVTCLIASNFLFNTVYAQTVSFMSGFVFFVLSGFCLLVIVVLGIYSLTRRWTLDETEHVVNRTND